MNKKELEGKVAIVTGGGSGIGKMSSLLYAQSGAKVVVADISERDGQNVADEIVEKGGEAIFVKTDVSQAQDNENLVNKALEVYGKLDIAFNNAGIKGSIAPLAEYPIEEWNKILQVNLSSVFYGMHYQIPAMLKSGGGNIVNTVSIMAQLAAYGNSGYVATKHGVLGLTKSASVEYGKLGIRANAVAPGFTETPMFVDSVTQDFLDEKVKKQGMGRMGTPQEIANMVLWLSGDKSSFCNGGLYVVDGGFLIEQ